jgi:hypothetical protein
MTFIEALVTVSIGLVLLVMLFAMTSSNTPNYAGIVESQGYTNVNIGESAWMGCGKGDSVLSSVHFNALGVDHKPVSGVVCCGLVFKSCTVRITP